MVASLATSASVGAEALREFWAGVVRGGGGGSTVFVEMVKLMVVVVDGKEASKLLLAQSIGALIVETKEMGASGEDSAVENLGVIGRSMQVYCRFGNGRCETNLFDEIRDLSKAHPSIDDSLPKLFDFLSEELKHAAAFALENVALGNFPQSLETFFVVDYALGYF
ncbi:hypothetical protein HDU98_012214 [Podochytrium sp. JEL0797]|nr:hypothetical protein HDU98_012214 [Podochytrium sp. JEL0797]